MALLPLNTDDKNFPLSDSPYLSRVSTHFNDYKNYAMLAFNPGFALQAAELNEVQELFFINQSLTQRMNANWINLGSTQTSPYTAPFWEGLIPLHPNYLTVTSATYNSASGVATINYILSPGWYLYTDKNSKLSFWIYNNNSFEDTTTTSANGTYYFGTLCSLGTIDCCQTNDDCLDQDSTLRDGSQESYQEFTCGSSRIQVKVNTSLDETLRSYNSLTNAPSNFFNIFTVEISATSKTIKYPNGYIVANIV